MKLDATISKRDASAKVKNMKPTYTTLKPNIVKAVKPVAAKPKLSAQS